MQKANPEHGAALVVSIHDVSPRTSRRTVEILRDLAEAGVGRVSLLVVPDHHDLGRISSDPAFCEWLRGRCAAGDEAVLHGYRHRRDASGGETPWQRFMTGVYTAGEGEFFDLDFATATARLERGKAELAAAGVPFSGFIAPAWLLGPEAGRAVREAGFAYTTLIDRVIRFGTPDGVDSSRSLVWSVRAGWRRLCSLAWNRALFRTASRGELLRVGIHPPDWSHPAIRSQILDLVRAGLAGREAITYHEWVTRRQMHR